MLNRRTICLALAALPMTAVPLRAQRSEIYAAGRIAIGGADPVAYFTHDAAVSGTARHALMWRGATWLFANATTMEAFEMDPQRYCPAYGGYCAHAMTRGSLATTTPEAFTVHQDRLYLTHSIALRALWRDDMAGFIRQADAHWPGVLLQ